LLGFANLLFLWFRSKLVTTALCAEMDLTGVLQVLHGAPVGTAWGCAVFANLFDYLVFCGGHLLAPLLMKTTYTQNLRYAITS
jgi:hypothetical protein